MPKAIRILPAILFLTWTTAGFAQARCQDNASTPVSTSPLPSPTGPFKVGRTAYYVKGAPGEGVMVHVWYPADTPTSVRPAPYVAGWPEVRQKILEPVRRLFREASCDFEQGRIYSYALEQAPVANRERRYPLIVFAPGLGISSFVYAALIEELASDGYIVAGVEYTPVAPFVVFPDGTIGNFDSARQEAMSKLPEGSPERLQLEKKLIEDGATSLIRALDTLSKLERPDRLAGRLDLERVAVLGHSFGAMSALRVAEKDRRFRAGLSLDGFSDGMLAFAVEDGRRIRGRFGLMFRPLSPNQGGSIPKLIAALPRGTMLVKTESPQFIHMSFSDLPLLRAGDNQEVRTAALRHLEIVRTITRTFFDSSLRGAKATATDLPTHGYPELKVENSTN